MLTRILKLGLRGYRPFKINIGIITGIQADASTLFILNWRKVFHFVTLPFPLYIEGNLDTVGCHKYLTWYVRVPLSGPIRSFVVQLWQLWLVPCARTRSNTYGTLLYISETFWEVTCHWQTPLITAYEGVPTLSRRQKVDRFQWCMKFLLILPQ